jgi:aminoglycoside 3-N-acetyltransferase
MINEHHISRNNFINKSFFIDIFKELGVKKDLDLIVHSALWTLGSRIENPNDIIDAILESIGTKGTLIMPSHSGHLTDPHDWTDPPAPKEDIPKMIEEMKPFDSKTTKIRNRGVLSEIFFKYNGIRRSQHPLNSVIALGPKAKYFTDSHPLHECEGYGSPAWKFYKEQGYALLIGVGMPNSLTFIHLGEYLLDMPYLKHNIRKVLVVENGKKKFVTLKKYPKTGKSFIRLQSVMEEKKIMKVIKINKSHIYFFPFKDAIDISMNMMKDNPNIFNE